MRACVLAFASIALVSAFPVTLYGVEPVSTQSGYSEFISVVSSPDASGVGVYEDVAIYPEQTDLPATTVFATLVNGPETAQYYASDPVNGAVYQICAAEGSIADCVVSVPEYSFVSTYTTGWGAYTTLTANDVLPTQTSEANSPTATDAGGAPNPTATNIAPSDTNGAPAGTDTEPIPTDASETDVIPTDGSESDPVATASS